jgi:RES domain-containing protein
VLLDLDRRRFAGVWYRHVPAGGEPLFRPERPRDRRWQRGDVVEGVYLADSEETAWAEWYRALAELAMPPMQQLPRDLWRFDVNVVRVADLSSPERLMSVGLPSPEPDRRQWPSFQTVGETLLAEGWAGLLLPGGPSAERTRALPVPNRRRAFGVRPLPPPSRYEEPPVPPRGLRA